MTDKGTSYKILSALKVSYFQETAKILLRHQFPDGGVWKLTVS